jgi:hypothetical protein
MASESDEAETASFGGDLEDVSVPRIRGLSFYEVKEESTLSLHRFSKFYSYYRR